jgi:hypothetical protein
VLPQNSQPAGEDPRSLIDGIVHFDATAVRREKMRAAAKKRRLAGLDVASTTTADTQPPAEAAAVQQTATAARQQQDIPPAERPGLISLVPLANVALAPSPHGPTVPAALP